MKRLKLGGGYELSAKSLSSNNARRKLYLVIDIIVNFSILAYFKYFSGGIMPLGISFYTFTAVGYIADVYRRTIPAEKNFINFSLFLSFFPNILSGPIERGEHLLPQIREYKDKRLLSYRNITHGATLFLWGLFMKMVIADRAAIFVDTVYSSYRLYGMVELFTASILYTLQIYSDFAGYSLMAVGCAEILGFNLLENFDVPYFSQSIKEFWRRWHISLSTWLRDNIYIPLGGSRCTKKRKYLNVFITFLCSGIWHGNSLNFVVWGVLHGLYQIVGDITTPSRNRINDKYNTKTVSFGYHFGKAIVTFLLVDFAWIFFRAESIVQALKFIKRMLFRPNLWVLHNKGLLNFGLNQTEWHILIISLIAVLIVDIIRYVKKQNIDDFLADQPWWFQCFTIIGIFFSIITFGVYGPAYDPASFIYLQF